MHCFSDADWGGDIITRRSTTGYIIFAAGGPISWQSKLQPTVATSSLESEYMALYAGLHELVWIRGVMKELKCPLSEPTPFLVDSKSALDLAHNPVFHKRSKHIDIKYHWIREHVNPGGFETATLVHCKTLRMAADIFTKSLVGSLFFEHATTINGQRVRKSEDFTSQGEHGTTRPPALMSHHSENAYGQKKWESGRAAVAAHHSSKDRGHAGQASVAAHHSSKYRGQQTGRSVYLTTTDQQWRQTTPAKHVDYGSETWTSGDAPLHQKTRKIVKTDDASMIASGDAPLRKKQR